MGSGGLSLPKQSFDGVFHFHDVEQVMLGNVFGNLLLGIRVVTISTCASTSTRVLSSIAMLGLCIRNFTRTSTTRQCN